jgi:hypothetical protein
MQIYTLFDWGDTYMKHCKMMRLKAYKYNYTKVGVAIMLLDENDLMIRELTPTEVVKTMQILAFYLVQKFFLQKSSGAARTKAC